MYDVLERNDELLPDLFANSCNGQTTMHKMSFVMKTKVHIRQNGTCYAVPSDFWQLVWNMEYLDCLDRKLEAFEKYSWRRLTTIMSPIVYTPVTFNEWFGKNVSFFQTVIVLYKILFDNFSTNFKHSSIRKLQTTRTGII